MITALLMVRCGDENTVAKPGAAADSSSKKNNPRYFIEDCRKLLAEARQADSVLLSETEFSQQSATRAINSFSAYATYCHNDSLSPVFLIKTAQVARAAGQKPLAKSALDHCLENYPSFRDKAAALFLLAQLYDDPGYMEDEREAAKLYNRIIEEYPDTDWALNAKGALSYIGKTDEEIMMELKKKDRR